MSQLVDAYVAGDPVRAEKINAVRIAAARAGMGGTRQRAKQARCLMAAQVMTNAARLLTGIDINKADRSDGVVRVRWAVMWLLCKRGYGLKLIAASGLGVVEHSSVIKARRKGESDPDIRALAALIERAEAGDFSGVDDAIAIVAPEPPVNGTRLIREAAREQVRSARNARKAAIIEAVRGGASVRDVSRQYGVSGARIYQIVGPVLGPHKFKLALEKIEEIVAKAGAGLSDSEVGRQTGVNHATVRKYRREAGIPASIELSKPSCRVQPELRATIVFMANSGLTYSQIAEQLRLTRSAVAGVVWRWRHRT